MLSSKIKQLRRNLDLTQQQMADTLNVDRSTYSYYETGKTIPPLDKLVRLAKIFNVSTDELLSYRIVRRSAFSQATPSFNANVPLPESYIDLAADEKDLVVRFRQLDDNDRSEIITKMDKLLEDFSL